MKRQNEQLDFYCLFSLFVLHKSQCDCPPCVSISIRNVPSSLNWTGGISECRNFRTTSATPAASILDLFTTGRRKTSNTKTRKVQPVLLKTTIIKSQKPTIKENDILINQMDWWRMADCWLTFGQLLTDRRPTFGRLLLTWYGEVPQSTQCSVLNGHVSFLNVTVQQLQQLLYNASVYHVDAVSIWIHTWMLLKINYTVLCQKQHKKIIFWVTTRGNWELEPHDGSKLTVASKVCNSQRSGQLQLVVPWRNPGQDLLEDVAFTPFKQLLHRLVYNKNNKSDHWGCT